MLTATLFYFVVVGIVTFCTFVDDTSISFQVMAAIAQPFTLVIPTRYSQAWHPQNERTVSTTLSSLGELLQKHITFCMVSKYNSSYYCYGIPLNGVYLISLQNPQITW